MKTFNSFADFGKSTEAQRIRYGRKRISTKSVEPILVNGVRMNHELSVEARIKKVKEELGPVEVQQEYIMMFGKKVIIKPSEREMCKQANFTIYTETIIVKR